MVVELNSSICKRPFFADKNYFCETLANPMFFFRGVVAIQFCAAETDTNSMQTASVWVIWKTAKGRCKAMLGKFHQETTEFHCFPGSLMLQRCFVGRASMDAFSFATALAGQPRNFREKSFESWVQWFSSTWLQYTTWVLCLPLLIQKVFPSPK